MPDQALDSQAIALHGAAQLPEITIDAYNAELRCEDGFLGDRASKRAFRGLIEEWREKMRQVGEDPLGDLPSDRLSKKQLDHLLTEGPPEAAGLMHAVVEDFAQELASIIRQFLKLKGWRDTQALVVGGGMRQSRIGELAIGRAGVLLKGEDGIAIELIPIRNHPDDAGLIGCAHLVPAWLLAGHDAMLAVDIGGTNIRAGVVALNIGKAPDLSQASVWHSEIWRHSDDKPKRDEAVTRLGEMLQDLIARAEKEGISLAPLLGIGCPGRIEQDGSIESGSQNLPGNWESSRFNLPQRLRDMIPTIGAHETLIVMHNDAVVQGLSEAPLMRDFEHWGVLTIGTGLGNARFTNRKPAVAEKSAKAEKKAEKAEKAENKKKK